MRTPECAFEDMKFRFDKASNKVFVHFYGKPEAEIDHGDAHFNEAIQAEEKDGTIASTCRTIDLNPKYLPAACR